MGGTLNEYGKRDRPSPSFYENYSGRGTDELQLRVQVQEVLPVPHGKKKKKRSKIADHEPRRPLSAYNFYFSEERELVIALLSAPEAEAEAADEENDGKESKPCGSNDAASDDSSTSTLISTDTATATAISKPDEAAVPQDTEYDERDSAIHQLQQLLSTRKIPHDEMEELKKKINANTKRILDTHIEGDRVKKSHKRMHGKITFQKLARIIGQRWRTISDAEKKQHYFDD